MTVPHYRPVSPNIRWANPWDHARYIGAWRPDSKGFAAGYRIAAGRLWVIVVL